MVNSPPCQVEAVSLHPINTPSGQVGVTPCKSEGIEPFSMVNSLACQVKAMSLHPINTPWVKSGSPLAIQKVLSPSPSQLSARSSWGHVLTPNQHSVGSSQNQILNSLSG